MISPGLRIGRYEVGKRLGKGGFGVVHIARDVELDRDIAIKVLKPEYVTKPQIVQRFIKEARAAAKIGHPGIVTVFECGQIGGTGTRADGNAYIAMELLVGESLGDRLMDGGRMPTAQAIAVTRQLAAALGAAHTAGIIHRDLKPDNVFLVPDAAVHGGARVKVLDFGVAKLLELGEDGVNTHSQMMLGTPKYMSPEQARSAAKADHRADIYTLGCMVFEMLTGRAPFGGDAGEQLLAHQKTPPPSARLVVPTVPLALDALIRRMLAKSPDDRPQSMAEVVDALGDLADEPDTMVRTPIDPAAVERTPTPTPLDTRVSAEITTVAEAARPVRTDHRKLLVAAGTGAVVISALVMFLVMKRDRPAVARSAPALVALDAAVESDAPRIVFVEVDAAPLEDVHLECLQALDAKRWPDAITCADQLRKLDDARGERIYRTAHVEIAAEASHRKLADAVAARDLATAKEARDKIPPESVYRKDAETAFNKLEAEAAARSKSNVRETQPSDPCNGYDGNVARGQDAFSSGRPAEAMSYYEQALKCGTAEPLILRYLVAAACKAKRRDKARVYWKRTNAAGRDAVESLCASNGIFRRDLED